MPLFRYSCQRCEAEVELLIRKGEAPTCPECASRQMVKQLSAFAPMGERAHEPGGCGAPSCCRLDGGCQN